MLAFERRATVLKDGSVNVHAQPFGGGIRILNPTTLQGIIGTIKYDSEQAMREGDFRILIPPSKWELVKQYCLQRLEDQNDSELESLPDRELVEEFAETFNFNLRADQYTVRPLGFVIENNPTPTDNLFGQGQLTVRLYRTFEVRIIDIALSETMLAISQQYSDRNLEMRAIKDFQSGGRGWANSILTLPLDTVIEAYIMLKPEIRHRNIVIENHLLDKSVLAILGNVDVPEYQRL